MNDTILLADGALYSAAQKNGFLAEEKGIPAEAQGGAGPLLLGARVNTFATVTDVENYLPNRMPMLRTGVFR